ncbi:class VII unconventional myosin [Planoprotostelium fungivorum]|uniref:Class VII unconventional myosin n=1 Tax=Planoprotostelium fungivorum TaxID=1890364 RepID=A0A2P6N2D3_9EUKA|nr:class VII unconventional myosin [Planoprotostelium fungivorum]
MPPQGTVFFERGALVWYFSPQDSWVPARFISQKGIEATIQLVDHATGEVPENEPVIKLCKFIVLNASQEQDVDINSLVEVQSPHMAPEVADMVGLSELNEPSILHNLRRRFNKTYVGSILVSVNPYQPLPDHYDENAAKSYANVVLGNMAPHIYAVADVSYRSMKKDKKNQSILISGESGAGKTEATKYIMKYITQLTGGTGKIEKALLDAHPILEAFGNAKTRQNDNSSRFGKFFQIYFKPDGSLSGTAVSHYLLEKSRVTHQADGEGNYHIFYYLLDGLEGNSKSKLQLADSSQFSFTSQGGYTPDKSYSKKWFNTVSDAMKTLGVSDEDKESIWSVLAAILHIGNLSFQADAKKDTALLANKDLLVSIATILQVPPAKLEVALSSRSMSVAGTPDVVIPLKVDEAKSNRDAFAKAMYGKLFDWIMIRINDSLKSDNSGNFIGILDIFGFETFPTNSFEQFCINYSNEQLQQFFSKYLFKQEQDEYIKEKIQWSKVEFNDNSIIIDLIEKKPLGILSVLDEECSFPKGTDQSFLEKCAKLFAGNPKFTKPLRVQNVFTISHYAAEVVYTVTGFLSKNKDTVNQDLVQILQHSTNALVAKMYNDAEAAPQLARQPSRNNMAGALSAGGRGAPAAQRGPGFTAFGAGRGAPAAAPVAGKSVGGPTKKSTIGIQFKDQLKSLLTILSSTEGHFIRAIKPNHIKEPLFFDGMNVLRQLSYSGLLETIRIRGAGYSYRPTFAEFVSRFGVFLPRGKKFSGDKDKCEWILDELEVPPGKYQIGITKLFLKDEEYNKLMDQREGQLHVAASKIQRQWRFHDLRVKFVQKRRLSTQLQTAVRVIAAKKEYKILKVERVKQEKEARIQKEKEEREKREREEKEKKERLERERREREEEERVRIQEEKERKEREEREERARKEKARLEAERKAAEEEAARREEERLAQVEAARREAARKEELRAAEEAAIRKVQQEAFEEKQRQQEEARQEVIRRREEEEKRAQEEAEERRKVAEEEAEERRVQQQIAEIQEKKRREEEKKRMEEQAEERRREEEARKEEERIQVQEEQRRAEEETRKEEERQEEMRREEERQRAIEATIAAEKMEEEMKWMKEELRREKDREVEQRKIQEERIAQEQEAARKLEEKPANGNDWDDDEPEESSSIYTEPQYNLSNNNEVIEDIMPAFEQYNNENAMNTYRKGMTNMSRRGTISRSNTSRFNKMAGQIDKINESNVAYRVTFDPHVEFKKLIFNSIAKPPLLIIPEGNTFTKYDYSLLRKIPFSFPPVADEPDILNPPLLVLGGDPVEMDEPEDGLQPESLDIRTYDRERADAPFVRYVPVFHRFSDEVKPARSLSDFSSEETVTSYDQMKKTDPERVRFINITKLSKKDHKDFIKKANYCTKCEAFVLTHSEFKSSISSIKLPLLRHVDVSSNQMNEMTPLLEFFKEIKHLDSAILLDNPILEKPDALDRIFASYPNLRSVNNTNISIEQRLTAINTKGSKTQKKNYDLMAWDLHFCKKVPEMKEMSSWEPGRITVLNLAGCNLSTFHVGTLVNLESLDLSRNMIKDLLGSGLERCDRLRSAKFSNNFISKRSTLQVFQYIPSLRTLDMRQNKDVDSLAEFTDYRSYLIYITRNLKGTNRCPGLITLDDEAISMDERITAIEKYSKKKRDGLMVRYALSLIDYYGHHQMKTPNYLNAIKHLRLPKMKLSMVDVKGMYSLEVLDVAGNDLTMVEGLNELLNLRVLNLSGNPLLELEKTFKDLANHEQLEQLSFAIVGNDMHPHYINSKTYRERVLKALLPRNRYFGWLDNIRITTDERIKTLRQLPNTTKEEVEKYRFEVALLVNNVPVADREYHYSVSSPGVQYDADYVISLRRTSFCRLKSYAIQLDIFPNLEEINFHCNKLTTLLGMGLESLPNLKVLDVSKNRIDMSMKDLAAFLDGMKSLECVALRENPCMITAEDRFKLIGTMKSMREITCKLQVIDIFVTIDERIEAWIANGGNKDEAELIRYKAIMFQRMPPNLDPTAITTLDLSEAGFKKIDVSVYPNLEILLLKGNLLRKVEGTGIHKLQKLSVLNLQNNRLKNLDKIATLVRALPKLQSIGLSGNPWPASVFDTLVAPGWRKRLLVLLPELHKRRSHFKMIDDDPISVDELIEAWKVVKGKDEDVRHFRFHILMLTKIPLSEPSMVQELDFSSCGLNSMDLSKYSNLIKLSLANNNFTTLIKSVAISLDKLRGFDLSNNGIKDMEEFVNVTKAVPNLQVLMTYGNPAFERVGEDPDAIRVEFLSKVFAHVQPQKLALLYLNGKKVTTREKCAAMSKAKTDLTKEAIETIRLNMALQEMGAQPGDTELDLSNFDFSSLTMLHRLMPNITHLNLSHNRLQVLEAEVIQGLPNLVHLDLSHNELGGIKEITQVLKDCPKLESIVLLLSTAGKETALVKDYAFDLFKKLKNMVTIDGMKNPFGTVKRKMPTPIRMSVSKPMEHSPIPSRARSTTVSTEDVDTSLQSMYERNSHIRSNIAELNRGESVQDLFRARSGTIASPEM